MKLIRTGFIFTKWKVANNRLLIAGNLD
jgi:hypothetical protein